MDFLSLLGIVIGFSAIVGGNLLGGGELAFLLNFDALVIVLGGTLGATFLQFSPGICWHSVKMFLWVFKPKKIPLLTQKNKIVNWSTLARKEGLLGLEGVIEKEQDNFTQKGLQLLVDGNEPEIIRDCMELDLNTREDIDIQSANLYKAMGGYAPALGIVGSVIGLIQVMQNLTNPELLGEGIATAFVSTIYGVGFANLFFLPIASKLRAQVLLVSQGREMMMEGVCAIAEGENPRNIELRLTGFMPD